MPVMDGYQTTQAIRAGIAGSTYIAVPIIAMTANAMTGDREKCLAEGMDDYLSKPIESDLLINKLVHWHNDKQNINSRNNDIYIKHKVDDNGLPPISEAVIDENNLPVLDQEAVLKRVSSRQKLLTMLVNNFIADCPLHLQALELAKEEHNIEQLQLTAHTFKGMSGNLGGLRLQAKATALEIAIKSNESTQIEELIKQLNQECQLFMKELSLFEQQVVESS